MKRFFKLFPVCIILVLLLCSHVFSQSPVETGECGINVTYTIDKTTNTITFTRTNPGQAATWADACKSHFENGKGIKEVIVADTIIFPSGNQEGKFSGLTDVEKMDLRLLDVSNVTNMREMFKNSSSLISLDLSGWNTSKVKQFYSMFQDCTSLTTLYLRGWNFTSINQGTTGSGFSDMFKNCTALTTLDISGWTLNRTTTMSSMFRNCGSLKFLDFSTWNIYPNADAFVSNMFVGCGSLTTVKLGTDTLDGMRKNIFDTFSNKSGTWYKIADLDGNTNVYGYINGSTLFGIKEYNPNTGTWSKSYAYADNLEVTYDGQPHSITVTAAVPEDAVCTFEYSTDGVTYGPDNPTFTEAGSIPNIVYYRVSTNNANYPTQNGSATMTIKPRAVTVTADDITKNYGDPDPDLTATIATLAEGDDESVISYTLSREEGQDLGTYIITPAGPADQGNYSVTFVPGIFTITVPESASGETCGTNVKWSVTGDTIIFSKGDGTADPLWGADCVGKFRGNASIKKAVIAEPMGIQDRTQMAEMFLECEDVEEMDLSKLVIPTDGDPISMEAMFESCGQLRKLNLQGWDTSRVTSMDNMFSICESLKVQYV